MELPLMAVLGDCWHTGTMNMEEIQTSPGKDTVKYQAEGFRRVPVRG